jgi:hypothetical protein
MRTRTLSERGCELFNVCYDAGPTKKKRGSCLPHIDIRYIYQKLMTSDFDIQLEKHEKKMKNATKKMFGFLEKNKRNLIGKLINNAMTNLIIFTLSDGETPCKLQKAKMNINFYLSLADKLYDLGDHHSAIIIRCAMSSFHIQRLGIKLNDRQKKIFIKFEKEYGTFLNMHSCHLKKILINIDYDKFYPSLMVLMTHLNKTKEYAKSYESIGKFPRELRNKEKQLEVIAKTYYNKYKNSNELLLELYNSNPLDHPIMINFGCTRDTHINEILNKISCEVNGKKNNKLKRTKKKIN